MNVTHKRAKTGNNPHKNAKMNGLSSLLMIKESKNLLGQKHLVLVDEVIIFVEYIGAFV